MKKLIPIFLLCAIQAVTAQKKEEFQNQKEQIQILQDAVHSQKKSIARLDEKLKYQKLKIDSLTALTQTTQENSRKLADELGVKIQNTENAAKDSITKLDKDVFANRLYWILGTLATLLLGGLLYWLLGKRISSSKNDVEAQIKNTKKSLEEESVKLDNKLVEVLESQLKIKQQEVKAAPQEISKEVDHSLALKVADEIIRIQKNLNQMDASTKGLKQLTASVKRIQDNFASNGYELVDMLGKEYNEGMKVIANFIPSDQIETGKQIITRIIKPQVNYNNEMIQSAQIEVSVGE